MMMFASALTPCYSANDDAVVVAALLLWLGSPIRQSIFCLVYLKGVPESWSDLAKGFCCKFLLTSSVASPLGLKFSFIEPSPPFITFSWWKCVLWLFYSLSSPSPVISKSSSTVFSFLLVPPWHSWSSFRTIALLTHLMGCMSTSPSSSTPRSADSSMLSLSANLGVCYAGISSVGCFSPEAARSSFCLIPRLLYANFSSGIWFFRFPLVVRGADFNSARCPLHRRIYVFY